MSARPIFIVGASRSGTALLRSVLNASDAVHIASETHYFDDLRPRLGEAATGTCDEAQRRTCEDYFLAISHRPYGHGGVPEEAPLDRGQLSRRADEIGSGGDAYFEAYCRLNALEEGRAEEASRWGEKTPRHVFRLGQILQRYPDAQALCMVRDPRAVVASYRDWKNQGGFDFDADPGHAEALMREHERTRHSYDVNIASLMWRATVRASMRARAQFGADRVRLVKYEELVEQPEATVRDIAAWTGVAFESDMLDVPLHNSSVASFSRTAGIVTEPLRRWASTMTPGELALVQFWCREAMVQCDYELLDAPATGREVASALVVLPAAVWRAGRANRHRMGDVPSYLWHRLRLALSDS